MKLSTLINKSILEKCSQLVSDDIDAEIMARLLSPQYRFEMEGQKHKKYNLITFEAGVGYITEMRKSVKKYVKTLKEVHPKILIFEDVNEKGKRIWTVGTPEEFKKSIDEEVLHEKV